MRPIGQPVRPRYPADQRWQFFKSHDHEEFTIIRLNLTGEELAGHPMYAYRVGVAVPISNPARNDLPDHAAYEALCRIEDLLLDAIEGDQQGLMIMVMTMSGFREYTFYTRAPDAVPAALAEVADKAEPYEIQFYVEHDAQWEFYELFRASCGCPLSGPTDPISDPNDEGVERA